MKRHIHRIIDKPLLSALVVGSIIHGFILLAMFIFLGIVETQSTLFEKWHLSPSLSLIQFITPYFVPFFVTVFAQELSHQKIQRILQQFPESNPNIVMRLNHDLVPDYINPVGQAWLEKHALDTLSLNSLLPSAMVKKLSNMPRKGGVIYEDEKHFGTETYHFKAKVDEFGAVFVTAEDITENKKLQDSLKHTLFQLNQLTLLLNENLNHYDPTQFDLFQTFQTMLKQVALASNQSIDVPNYVFCTFSEENKAVIGQIYQLNKDQVVGLTEPFKLESTGYAYAISKGKTDIFYEKWQPQQQSLEDFQQQFNPVVRQHVGLIKGYATYQSGSVSVIGFFKTEQFDKQFNDILKQIALFGHFFHRISQESIAIYEQFAYSLKALARASEANDEDTGQHIIRINEYAYALAIALGQPKAFCDEIRLTAMMHDVGKIHLDPAILKKPGALTDAERTEMMQHPIHGAKILGESDKMKMAREIALYHHEKFDGSGYPNGLAGYDIPLAARIVNLVDVYDALRQKRVYKPAFDHETAYQIITEGDGRTKVEEFDPDIMAAFKKIHHQFDDIFTRMT
ncbi:hypothetical protein CYQ88_01965 [Hydrogenovibrio sp. SC-1]|uniref:HD-GYP domain-containing protein n=1 Tax=Hydrogenovibrio sp. SC-1 TaxID=2065820 RepID=UPI000C7B6443|nr:HD domain-containing phosphohydrolase [Hydrogenovibrio sp. SC-1]PLA75357.1 hypothetical protein CYQ88_01965 [Hydrogenovibrio sp. SC-1]